MRNKFLSWMMTGVLILALFAALPIAASASGNTVLVPGEIQGNVTWTEDNVYVIENDTYIKPGAVLTIDPGVVVKIKPGVRVLVDGTLNASGTAGNKIYFTDYRDDTVGGDTNGDGADSTPSAGGWTYMLLGYNADATATLNQCVVRYGGGSWGGWGNDSLIVINRGSNVAITNSELSNSLLRGIRVQDATGIVNISNSTIHDNVNNGILSKNSAPTIGNNTISGNGQYGIFVEGVALPDSISENVFSLNTLGSIGLGSGAAGTSVNPNNSGVDGIWLANGSIANDVVWNKSFPYIITGDTYVNPGATLTINPGVIVKIKSGVRVLVDGILNASGTEEEKIYFSDFRDDAVGGDTNGDGAASTPSAGGWTYVLLGYNADCTANLNHCVVRYGGGSWGGWGNDSLIVISGGSDVAITNSDLSNSLLRGIRIQNATGSVNVSNSAIYDHAEYGLYINNSSGLITIADSQIYNSSSGQLFLNNSPNVSITGTPAQTIDGTAGPGTIEGSTKVMATAGTGNHLAVRISNAEISHADLQSEVPSGAGVIDPYTSGTNITGVDSSNNKYLAIYEANLSNKIVKFKSFTLTDDDIAPPNEAQIGGVEYLTLSSALSAAATDETVTLLKDITFSNSIKAEAKNATIDLNGFDLLVTGVGEHALQAGNGNQLMIWDKDGDGGSLAVISSGANKYAAYAYSGGHIIIEGSLTADYPGGMDNQAIIGAYASGNGSTIQITGNAIGYTAGVYSINDANIIVNGRVEGSYYGGFSAYNGSVQILGDIAASRALVAEYGGNATVQGNITGSNYGVEGSTDFGWNPPIIRVTGDVTGSGGAAMSFSNGADVHITGDAIGYITVSGSSSDCPNVVLDGDVRVNNGFGIGVFYGGTVTINGNIIGASPYLRLNNLTVERDDYTVSGEYLVYSNNTIDTPTPFSANTVKVAIPQGGYRVDIGAVSGGTIVANPQAAIPGSIVQLTVQPNSGKQLKAGTLKYNDGNDNSIAGTSFTMPPSNVTVTAIFEDVANTGSNTASSGTGSKLDNTITISTIGGESSVAGTLVQNPGYAQVFIEGNAFEKLDSADRPTAVDAGMAVVIFDKKAMDVIGSEKGTGDVNLAVREVLPSELSQDQKNLVGNSPVYDFAVSAGGKRISDFSGGIVTITIPYSLKLGEDPLAVVIWHLNDSNELIAIRGHYDGTTKTVTFYTWHFSKFVVGHNSIKFKDVPEGVWYEKPVAFLAARGITTGIDKERFNSQGNLSRGQFVVMLMRAYGINPDVNPINNFTDAGKTYYTNYLATAKELGIAKGIGDNQFAPEQDITRQEMFTLMYNALPIIGGLSENSSGKTLSDYSDAGLISPWAKQGAEYLLKADVISGNNGMLNPKATTTRAEMAQVLYNILKQPTL